jgi:protein-L-isoaspartate(D-aspartate) O-methyltransferase
MLRQNTPLEDSYLHKGLRKKLVDGVRDKGITDEKVLAALLQLPRHYFLEPAFERRAYEDHAFPIGAGQTISQPYTVAFQTQLLEVRKFDKVLEIGTGSGYQSCVLAALGAMVFTIERQRELYNRLDDFPLLKTYPNIKRFLGDGYEGLPTYGPFDRCIVTAAAPFIPEKLVAQLKPGGILVIPVGDEGGQKMMRLRKGADGSISEEIFGDFSFVPMLAGKTEK